MKYNRAMVTGGAGFIGSHIVGELLGKDLEVISVDNYLSGTHDNLIEYETNKNFKEVHCDICQKDKVEKLMEGVDIIFHEAASKKTICLQNPYRDMAINGIGTLKLLELAEKYHVEKFVHASSGSVYGEGIVFPQTEEHPRNPTSVYGNSKNAGEGYVHIWSREPHDLNTTVLRYFHVYGARQNSTDTGGVIPIFIRNILKGEPIKIFGSGAQERSFTYVKDVVRANMLVANADQRKVRGRVFNCASGINVTIEQLANKLKELMHSDTKIIYGPWVEGDIKVFRIDNMELRKLGFEFDTPFEDGLKETIKFMRTQVKQPGA